VKFFNVGVVGDLDGEDCPFCCTDNNLIDIDKLSEDREDR
jgi:hypothetical protein